MALPDFSSQVLNGVATLGKMQKRKRSKKTRSFVINDPSAIAAIRSTAHYQTLAIASFTGWGFFFLVGWLVGWLVRASTV